MPTQQERLRRDVDLLGQQFRVVLVGYTPLDAEYDRLQPSNQLREFTATATKGRTNRDERTKKDRPAAVGAPEDACACARGRLHQKRGGNYRICCGCLCLCRRLTAFLLFVFAACCDGVEQPIAAFTGSLCLIAAPTLVLVSLARRDAVPLFGTFAARKICFHSSTAVVLVPLFLVFELFGRGRSAVDLPAAWALPENVIL